jgi:hypothetical protein
MYPATLAAITVDRLAPRARTSRARSTAFALNALVVNTARASPSATGRVIARVAAARASARLSAGVARAGRARPMVRANMFELVVRGGVCRRATCGASWVGRDVVAVCRASRARVAPARAPTSPTRATLNPRRK